MKKMELHKWWLLKQRASAMILVMFIMSGMILVATSSVYLVLLSIKAGGVQAQSGRAYYAAEAGAEYLIWQLIKQGYQWSGSSTSSPIFTGSLPSDGPYTASYEVYYSNFYPLIFQSIGNYQNARRSVEIRFGD